jgi:hypothetical protein
VQCSRRSVYKTPLNGFWGEKIEISQQVDICALFLVRDEMEGRVKMHVSG